MNKLILAAILATMLVGCASHPEKPVDQRCANMANFARTMETLKEMGIDENGLDPYINVPAAFTFPYKMLRHEVYYTPVKNPAETFIIFYKKCDEAGYSNMMGVLESDELDHQFQLKKDKEAKMAAEKKKADEAAAAEAKRQAEYYERINKANEKNIQQHMMYQQY